MQPVRRFHQPVEICRRQKSDKAMTRYIEIVGWLIVSGLFVFAVGVLVGR
jgi:hypothetical protein